MGANALVTTAELPAGDNGVCPLCQCWLVWTELSYRASHVLVGSKCTALQEEA